MSAIDENKNIWSPITNDSLKIKHEKCRNITEEIYKRINITFQIKNVEEVQSDVSNYSEVIDSNELSNGTDLFAYDISDDIPSSVSDNNKNVDKYNVNVNNNIEAKVKKPIGYKRPKKKFRKRVKKRPSTTRKAFDSDESSDDTLPLSKVTDKNDILQQDSTESLTHSKYEEALTQERFTDHLVHPKSDSPDNVMGVPKITILTTYMGGEMRSFIKEAKKSLKTSSDVGAKLVIKTKEKDASKKCSSCEMTFKNAKKLRLHISQCHQLN